MIRLTGLVNLGPLRETGTRIPPTTEDVSGGIENMEQDQAPMEDKGPVDDHEGSMAKADLLSIHKKAGELYNMIAEDEELEGWVQAKITKAAEYITAVHNSMEYEKTKPTTIGNGEMSPADGGAMMNEAYTLEEFVSILEEAGYNTEELEEGKLRNLMAAGLLGLGALRAVAPPGSMVKPFNPQQAAAAQSISGGQIAGTGAKYAPGTPGYVYDVPQDYPSQYRAAPDSAGVDRDKFKGDSWADSTTNAQVKKRWDAARDSVQAAAEKEAGKRMGAARDAGLSPTATDSTYLANRLKDTEGNKAISGMYKTANNTKPTSEAYTLEEWMGIMEEAGYSLEEGGNPVSKEKKNVLRQADRDAARDAADRAEMSPHGDVDTDGIPLGWTDNMDPDEERQLRTRLRQANEKDRVNFYFKQPDGSKGMWEDPTEVPSNDSLDRDRFDTARGKPTSQSKLKAIRNMQQPKIPNPINENTVSRLQQLAGLTPLYENVTTSAVTDSVEEATLTEEAPKGWEATVKKMKKKKEIDNPWALAHWMKSRGYQPKAKKKSKE